uniref:Uncharacterized protein n=1 Tax=Ditylenchus dipsaci TaxID=166011 RepID=A0A915ERX4_9BILA
MTKIKKLACRPKTKADKLRERREAALESNQSDLVKEKQEREQLFLDEGGSSSDTDTEAFFNKGQVKKKLQQEENNDDDDDDEEDSLGGGDLDFPDGEDDLEQDGDEDEAEDDSDEIGNHFKRNNADLEDEDDGEEGKALEKKSKTKKRKRKPVVEASKDDDTESLGSATEDPRFKVVILNKDGPSKFLNPTMNFREELLRVSTEKCRVKKASNMAHVEKWRRVC